MILWLLPGVGVAIDGLFTFENFFPHFLGFGLALLASILAFAVTGIALIRSTAHRRLGAWLVAGAVLTILLAILFFNTFTPTAAGQLSGIGGLTERFLVTDLLGWYAVVGLVSLLSSRR
jgi:hypothetical protein